MQAQLILDQKGNGCNHEENVTSLNLLNTCEDMCTIIHIYIYKCVHTEVKFLPLCLPLLCLDSALDESKEHWLWVANLRRGENSSIKIRISNVAVLSHYRNLR